MFILQLLLVQGVIFIGLVILLRRLMARHATSTTAHLQGLSQDYLKKHDELKKRLEEGERQYQEQLAKIQSEAQQMKALAIQEAQEARVKLIEEARKEGEKIVQQAIQARDSIQKDLAQSMESKAFERACQLIQEVLPSQIRENSQLELVDELIRDGLKDLEKLETSEQINEVKVVSASPLSPSQRGQLSQRLKTVLGHEVTLQESIDPSIIAGLVIRIGHLVLDGSLSSKLRKAARKAQNAE